MIKLSHAKVGIAYQVEGVDLPQGHQKHLAHLGITKGSQVKVMSQTKQSAIVMVKTSRLAFDDSILETIMVSEVIGEESKACPCLN